MKVRSIIIAAAIALSSLTMYAGNRDGKFRMSVGFEIGHDFFQAPDYPFSSGAQLMAGWQLSRTFYAGLCCGVNEYLYKGFKSGHDNVKGNERDNSWYFCPDLFADFQINLSKNPSPLYLDARVGIGLFETKYVVDKGTDELRKYSTYHYDEDCFASLGIGKRIRISDNNILSVYLRQELRVLENTNTVLGVTFSF